MMYRENTKEQVKECVRNMIEPTVESGGEGITILGGDDFETLGSAVDLNGRTPNHGGGNWLCSNNWEGDGSGNVQSNATNRYASFALTNSDCKATANWRMNGGNDLQIYLRCDSFGMWSGPTYAYAIEARGASNATRIARYNNGKTFIASGSYTFDPDTTYKIELKCVGDSIELLIDDVVELSATDSNVTNGGYVGIRQGGGTSPGGILEDLIIEDLT